VLCDGEICTCEQLQIYLELDLYSFSYEPQASPDIPPLLDPPEGIRAGWLDQQLGKFEFVVLF
jgi:hypothetical protein